MRIVLTIDGNMAEIRNFMGWPDRIEQQLQVIRKQGETLTMSQQALTEAVAAVKKDSDDMAVRVDAIIDALKTNPDQAAIDKAATELGAVSSALRGYHATTPTP